MQRMLLIVAIDLKNHGLVLHVLNEGAGDSHRDVLHMVEVQGCTLPIIFEGFCRKCFIMTIDKTEEDIIMRCYITDYKST